MGYLLAILIWLLPATLLIYSIGYLREQIPNSLPAKDKQQLIIIKTYMMVISVAYVLVCAWILYDIFKAPPLDPRTNSAPDTLDFRAAAAAILTGILTCFAMPLWYAGRAAMNTLLRKTSK
jgi:hypothetical protein